MLALILIKSRASVRICYSGWHECISRYGMCDQANDAEYVAYACPSPRLNWLIMSSRFYKKDIYIQDTDSAQRRRPGIVRSSSLLIGQLLCAEGSSPLCDPFLSCTLIMNMRVSHRIFHKLLLVIYV